MVRVGAKSMILVNSACDNVGNDVSNNMGNVVGRQTMANSGRGLGCGDVHHSQQWVKFGGFIKYMASSISKLS